MNENNVLYSEASERRDIIYSPENNNIKKTEIEKQQYYIFQENKELKENHIKLSHKLEELKNKIKEKSIDVNHLIITIKNIWIIKERRIEI